MFARTSSSRLFFTADTTFFKFLLIDTSIYKGFPFASLIQCLHNRPSAMEQHLSHGIKTICMTEKSQ